MVHPAAGVASCAISEEAFIVIRYFLTSRNESLDDNKRLSFDKAILQLRADAIRVLANIPVPPPAGLLGLGGVAGVL